MSRAWARATLGFVVQALPPPHVLGKPTIFFFEQMSFSYQYVYHIPKFLRAKLRCCILGILFKLEHLIALTNRVQTILSF